MLEECRGGGKVLRANSLGDNDGTTRRLVIWQVREEQHSNRRTHLLQDSPRLRIGKRLVHFQKETLYVVGWYQDNLLCPLPVKPDPDALFMGF